MPQEPEDSEIQLNHRERATLRAVALGTAEISCSCEPDLFIDGLACCDQATAHRLAARGLVLPERTGRRGERVPARLSTAGMAALGESRKTTAAA
ncbi:hypothetical protein [Amycolatopsis nigrescens]|uniref:hypothetical protein n=1 Tax=Amycolatopsis nigrescens TaxID=381445 RepID=UPI0003816D33|nr:hypothetical protein [Amycolatopsis nigrescens]